MNRTHTNKGIPYYDDEMTQYILDAYAAAPDSVRSAFDGQDKHLLKRVSNATLEQKLYLLGKLGKRFAIFVADRGKISSSPFTFKRFTAWVKRRVITLIGPELRNWGAFIRADKEIIQHLSRLSIDINPKTMYLLRNYEEIATGIDEIAHINVKAAIDLQARQIVDEFILKILTYKSQLPSFPKTRDKMTQQFMLVLFFLSAHKERLIAPIEIAMQYGWNVKSVLSCLNALLELGMVQEEIMYGEDTTTEPIHVFQLTGYGAIIINQTRDKFIFP